MKKLLITSALALILGAVSAHAAGYQLAEYSITNLGRAFSGVGLVGDDFSALGYNPAGMSFNETNGFQMGATMVGIGSRVTGSASGYYNIPGGARSGTDKPYVARVLPNTFGQYKVNDIVTVGLGVYVPFGLATDYGKNWFGNTHALLSEIQAINVSPAVAVKLGAGWSLGAALNIQYTEANLTSAIERKMGGDIYYLGGKSDLKGDDTKVGFTVGAAYEPMEGTRFGLSYRSQVTHKLRGSNTVSGLPSGNGRSDIHAKVITPQTITLSANQVINEQWSASASVRWTNWRAFDELVIKNNVDGSTLSRTQEDWRDNWFYALGTDYKLNAEWTFRAGVAYDFAAARTANRTARIPDSDRIWTSVGASWTHGSWQVDVGYAHLFIQKCTATHSPGNPGDFSTFNATYKSRADIVGVGVQYKF